MTPRELVNHAAHLEAAAETALKNKEVLDAAGLHQVTNLLRIAKIVVTDDDMLNATSIPSLQVNFNWSGVLAIAHTIHSAAGAAIDRSSS